MQATANIRPKMVVTTTRFFRFLFSFPSRCVPAKTGHCVFTIFLMSHRYRLLTRYFRLTLYFNDVSSISLSLRLARIFKDCVSLAKKQKPILPILKEWARQYIVLATDSIFWPEGLDFSLLSFRIIFLFAYLPVWMTSLMWYTYSIAFFVGFVKFWAGFWSRHPILHRLYFSESSQ